MKLKEVKGNIIGVTILHPLTKEPCTLRGLWAKGAWLKVDPSSNMVEIYFFDDIMEFLNTTEATHDGANNNNNPKIG